MAENNPTRVGAEAEKILQLLSSMCGNINEACQRIISQYTESLQASLEDVNETRRQASGGYLQELEEGLTRGLEQDREVVLKMMAHHIHSNNLIVQFCTETLAYLENEDESGEDSRQEDVQREEGCHGNHEDEEESDAEDGDSLPLCPYGVVPSESSIDIAAPGNEPVAEGSHSNNVDSKIFCGVKVPAEDLNCQPNRTDIMESECTAAGTSTDMVGKRKAEEGSSGRNVKRARIENWFKPTTRSCKPGARCRFCSERLLETNVMKTVNGGSVTVCSNVECSAKGVIYVIYCVKCEKPLVVLYTKAVLKRGAREQLTKFQCPKVWSAHCLDVDHEMCTKYLRVKGLEVLGNEEDRNLKDERLNHWIDILQTRAPFGFNKGYKLQNLSTEEPGWKPSMSEVPGEAELASPWSQGLQSGTDPGVRPAGIRATSETKTANQSEPHRWQSDVPGSSRHEDFQPIDEDEIQIEPGLVLPVLKNRAMKLEKDDTVDMPFEKANVTKVKRSPQQGARYEKENNKCQQFANFQERNGPVGSDVPSSSKGKTPAPSHQITSASYSTEGQAGPADNMKESNSSEGLASVSKANPENGVEGRQRRIDQLHERWVSKQDMLRKLLQQVAATKQDELRSQQQQDGRR